MEELTQCEFTFHNTLYEATDNQKLVDILYELHGISARFWHYLVFGKQELLDQFKDHRKIFDALTRKESKRAGEAMEKHIQNFVKKVRGRIL